MPEKLENILQKIQCACCSNTFACGKFTKIIPVWTEYYQIAQFFCQNVVNIGRQNP